jgi:PRTRC genetic system ThiF family protein
MISPTPVKIQIPLTEYRGNKELQIILVGCGGTGSWLTPHLFRLCYLLKQHTNITPFLHLYDPDIVEEKNIIRQNFAPAEIGIGKATTLTQRYNLAWGMNAIAHIEKIEEETLLPKIRMFNPTTIIIGCVDNNQARRSIHDCLYEYYNSGYETPERSLWQLDCGNHYESGQVLLGNWLEGKDNYQLNEKVNLCSAIKAPTQQHPELLEIAGLNTQRSETSCGESLLRGEQSLNINSAIALTAADYLFRLLLTKDLDKYATYLDLKHGDSQSLKVLR